MDSNHNSDPLENLSVCIEGMNKSFSAHKQKHQVLKSISFCVPKGNILGIIGRSGAGKSTLLRCINGLEKPDSGTIYIQGMELSTQVKGNRQALLRRIGTVFQNPNLLSTRTVFDNIALPLEMMGVSLKERERLCLEMVNLVGLKHKAWAYSSQLSGGQKQRVAIARALVAEPTLLLCDEFTSALDPETALEILLLLNSLNKRLGITIILITHDMKVIRDICDEVCVLKNGEIVEYGAVEKIIVNAQHPETKALLDSFLNRKLPDALLSRIRAHPTENCEVLLHLIFSKENAYEPFITNVIQKFNVSINIIAGNVDHIRGVTFGSLMILISYNENKLKEILEYFYHYKVTVEKLGYIEKI